MEKKLQIGNVPVPVCHLEICKSAWLHVYKKNNLEKTGLSLSRAGRTGQSWPRAWEKNPNDHTALRLQATASRLPAAAQSHQN